MEVTIDKDGIKSSTKTQPAPTLFVAKSYTIIIALNVLVNILGLLLMADYMEYKPANRQLEPFLYFSFGGVLYGFVSCIVLLVRGAKSTNIKILRRYAKVYFIVYLALFVGFAIIFLVLKLPAFAGWAIAGFIVTILCSFAVFILPFAMLCIAVQHSKLFARFSKAAERLKSFD